MKTHPVAMSIAGSDSSGGAGIQADLRAFKAFGVYGTTAITAITAQNPDEVTGVLAITSEMVEQQISTVFNKLSIGAVKTGMLFSSEIIKTVVKFLKTQANLNIVVDPVMIATSGSQLINDEAVGILKTELLPLATLATPNLPEAEVLAGVKITDEASLITCGHKLVKDCGCNFLIKGGHSDDEVATDYLFLENDIKTFKLQRLENYYSSHGSGCSLSSAIAAQLAKGETLESAITSAKQWVYNSIKDAVKIGDESYGMWQ